MAGRYNVRWSESTWDIYKCLIAASFLSEISILTIGPKVNLCPHLPGCPLETAVVEENSITSLITTSSSVRMREERGWRKQETSYMLHVIISCLCTGKLRWIFHSL